MTRLLTDLNRILSARDRLLAGGVLMVVLAMATVEVVGIGSVFWFVSALAQPETITQLAPLAWLHEHLGAPERDEFVLWVGALLLGVMIGRNLLQLLTVWAQQRFVLFRNHVFAERLLHAYLRMPYAYYLRSNTSELSKNLLNEVSRVASGMLFPVVEALSSALILTAITAFLLVQDAAMTATIAAIVGAVAIAGYLPLHRRLTELGRERMAADAARFRAIGDALGSVKDVRVLGRAPFFLARFVAASDRFFRRELRHKVLSQVPHFALETVSVVGILGFVLYVQASNPGNAPQIIATLSLYAVAAYRLMPQVKNIVRDLTELRFSASSLEMLADDLARGLATRSIPVERPEPLRFAEAIRLENVSFRYEGAERDTLSEISLKIPCRSSVALVGPTGAGKTTLVDLVLGLLQPTAGTIHIDGRVLSPATTSAWQANIGYVPQSIFLSDDTIRRNIAFGLSESEIVEDDVRRAARLAHLDGFVEGLPDGYETAVGERGVRLSGGQRQRIGIARALYHRPRLLVMDEGTSALDGSTERAVADAVAALTPEMTVILIAHRLATVRACHIVFLLDGGRLVDQGSFDALLSANASFRRMAQLA